MTDLEQKQTFVFLYQIAEANVKIWEVQWKAEYGSSHDYNIWCSFACFCIVDHVLTI